MYHRFLLEDRECSCFGGGSYIVDDDLKLVLLAGSSEDFGKPQWEKLRQFPIEWKDYEIRYENEPIYPIEKALPAYLSRIYLRPPKVSVRLKDSKPSGYSPREFGQRIAGKRKHRR